MKDQVPDSRPLRAGAPDPAPDPQHLDISVIIACYNGAETLGETLGALTAQDWDRPWEVVLADNASTDASVAVFRAHARTHPEVAMRVVDASRNRGKSYALNVAIGAARGRALLFCDADDVVAPGWLAAMGAALETQDFVAARMDLARLNPGWIGGYRDNNQIHGLDRIDHAPYCAHAGGGTFGFRRAVFDQVGPFDPDFAYLEDADFCVRAHLHGFRLSFVPEAVMHVRFRDTPERIRRQAYNYNRYRALLRRRYAAKQVQGGLRPWLSLSRRLLRLARLRLADRIRGKTPAPIDRARDALKLGTVLGDLMGALAFRVPPKDR